MNQQPKRDRQRTQFLDAYAKTYAKESPQPRLLHFPDELEQNERLNLNH